MSDYEAFDDEALTRSFLDLPIDRRRALLTLLGVGAGAMFAPSALASAVSRSTAAAGLKTFKFAEADMTPNFDIDGPGVGFETNRIYASVAYDRLFSMSIPNSETQAFNLLKNGIVPAPQLAKSYDVSKSGLNYTVVLRKGVVSRFGNELTSKDVLNSFSRTLAYGATGRFLLATVGGITEPAQIETPSKYVVKLRLKNHVPDLLQILAQRTAAILDWDEVSQHISSSDAWAHNWLASNTAGYGAYTLAASVPGQQFTLKRVAKKEYYGTLPPTEYIIVIGVPDDSTRLQLLLSGQVDAAVKLSPLSLATAAKDKKLNVSVIPGTSGYALVFDVLTPPFDNPAIRRGIAHAIPYSNIVNAALRGYGSQEKSMIYSFLPSTARKTWKYPTDVTKAKALLAPIAGQTITLTYGTGLGPSQEMAIQIQAGLAQAGVNVRLESMALSDLQANSTPANHKLGMFINLVGDVAASAYYHCFNLYTPNGFLNRSRYSNPKVDQLLAQLAVAAQPKGNPPKAVTIANQVHDIVLDDLPIIPLVWRTNWLAMDKKWTIPFIHGPGGFFDGQHDVKLT